MNLLEIEDTTELRIDNLRELSLMERTDQLASRDVSFSSVDWQPAGYNCDAALCYRRRLVSTGASTKAEGF